ncbi:hypothetical protein IBL26_20305 [Roseomonas aerophila]|uniref:Uncharacterized protein n=1 Tax=Teichococcus aerophilus TaxID=1224513 RepID=A0ABR7RS76_9PROT|nr:hypothetical protein [Pseudoroseomonas aerophila]MBC9209198.1 hypothetical protein [Pseudoroseomonas aerophila]
MRRPGFILLNGLAWVGILALAGLALAVVRLLGFPGVLILGLLTTLICVSADLSRDVPTWSRGMFESRGTRRTEAEREDGRQDAASLGYYRGCGFVLIAAGLAGTVWELW